MGLDIWALTSAIISISIIYILGPLGRPVHCNDRAIQNKEWINKIK